MAALVLVAIGVCYQKLGFIEFAIDDPYIHLALAENLLKQHYGHNLGEFSSPSSSLLFPWLLLPGVYLDIPIVWTLSINGLSACLSAAYLADHVDQRLISQSRGLCRRVSISLAACAVLVGSNGLALVLYGMEHSIHLLGVVLWLIGIVELIEHRRAEMLFWGSLLCILIRYDAAPAFLISVALLVYFERYKAVTILLVIAGLFYGGHALYFIYVGLDPVSGSVLTKLRGSDGPVEARLMGLWHFLTNKGSFGFWMPIVSSSMLLLWQRWIRGSRSSPVDAMLVAWVSVAACCLAYLFVAIDLGFNGRYEAACHCALLATLMLACCRLQGIDLVLGIALSITSGLVTSERAIGSLKYLPLACLQTRQQQVAIGDLARHWGRPVAVNVPGTASFGNDEYVLDLVGLGNQAIRKAIEQQEPDILDRYVRAHKIQLVMIYPQWYPGQIPTTWTLIACLVLPDKVLASPPARSVAIYAVDEDSSSAVRAAVKKWETSGARDVVWAP